ncbi:MAG: CBS domain-containing protein [Betaproteobacteria bacterium]|nr:CBS domain-containing protein [Betaproteobacteria bacterium]
MLVRNWMQTNPVTIAGDTLVSEAKRILFENNLHALAVVEEGRLRGLVTRAHCIRAGHFVMRTQSPNEFDFFVTRLKVKDIMVRNPATLQADDTMEHCLLKGRELGVAQFPVMEGGAVIGIISANEIFQLAAHFLGAWEKRSGVTIAPIQVGPGVLGRIVDVVEEAGAVLQAIYPIGREDHAAPGVHPVKRIIVRFHGPDTHAIVTALENAGFQVLEAVDATHRPRRAA